MLLEKILFPAPNPPHYSLTSHGEHLFWLPSSQDSTQTLPIPCMLYSPSNEAKFFFIWCHGNGCDIGTMHMTLTALSRRLRAHMLIFEYPSYGLCTATSPSQVTINNHAERAYSFVRDTLNWPTDRIIIYGHSIGSGTACYIASTKPICALILQSPYTSISNLVREKVGILYSLIDRPFWNNLEAMKRITCPILFIHGQRDGLIPSQHSQVLYDSLSHIEKKKLVFLPNDDHNSISDPIILMYLETFLNEHFDTRMGSMPRVQIDLALRHSPPITQTQSSGLVASLIPALRTSTNATISTVRSLFSRRPQREDEQH